MTIRPSNHPTVKTLDVHFQNTPGTIAVYLIRHANGAVIVDTGPGSTVPALQAELYAHGLAPRDITDVLLTHIHLDHAGAAGWLAQQGARIHVHPVGAPHLLNPEKLLASAKRIYGEDMDRLWGAFLPVPPDQLIQHNDGDLIEIGGCRFTALETPGHAEHHHAYLFEDVCFSGDVGGVRLAGIRHIRLPTPPPEVHFEKWRASLERLRRADFKFIAPGHFGLYADKDWHLAQVARAIDQTEAWTTREMASDPAPEVFRARFADLQRQLVHADGLDNSVFDHYELTAGTGMSADGVYRYWKKFRASPQDPKGSSTGA